MSAARSLTGALTVFFLADLLVTFGCSPPIPENVGGLDVGDFEPISLNGFDPADNQLDKNDYAWAMEYFVPDGAGTGRIYVGTGNDMIGLIYQGISAVMGVGELGEVSARPPEIRRYLDTGSPADWERVFDYRDVEQDPNFQTIGFRFMKAYRAQADGTHYLYAATMGQQAKLWRTASGNPGTWELAWDSGQTGSVRWLEEHRGLLYLAFANEIPESEQIGKVWATDGARFWPVVEDGFGDPENTGVMCLASFNGWLYAGTSNAAGGYQVWKLEGPSEGDPIRVLANGGPSPANECAITPCVFGDKLYLGSQLNPAGNIMRGMKGADMIRIGTDDQWEVVVGPSSLSGYGSGFSHWPNTYIWSMAVHDGWLYAATYDQVSAFFNVLENLDKVIAAFLPKPQVRNMREANIFESVWNAGSDLYKSPDGVTWYPVTLTGFGDPGNYGIRTMISVGDTLYLGTTNPFDGLEVWRAR